MPAITKVYLENHFYGADDVDGTGTITVQQDAFIEATADNGIEIKGGPWKVKVDGYIESDRNGLVFYDPTSLLPNSTVTVGTEATIISTNAAFNGIRAEQAVDVVNSGLILGGTTGIRYENIFHSTSKTISITNNLGGEIRGDDYGIYLDDGNHDLILKNAGIIDEVVFGRGSTITNSGTIEDLYQLSGGSAFGNTITNSGTINQGVDLSQANDIIKNSGTIHGALALYDGTNTVTNSGEIGKSLSAGGGNDTLTNSGDIGDYVHLGDGINKVTNGGTIDGYLELGSGNDTVGNTGRIAGYVTLFDGKNALTNSGVIAGDVTFGINDDMATNTGSIFGSLFMGAGNDKVTNGGYVAIDVSLGTGTNTLTNSGHISGDVSTGKDSNNTISNTGAIDGTFTMIYGDLTLTNSGTIGGDIVIGLGTHKITNTGTFAGGLKTSGSSDDTFTNSKLIVGVVNLADGDNKVTNTGTINQAQESGGLTTGGGNDVVVSTGHVFGDIDLGSGDDKFTGGNFTDLLRDGAGNDVYNLGGGNDHIHWIGQGNDTVDGGAGIDQFSAEGASEAAQINLDTKAVGFLAYHLAASSAVTSTSTTTVKNFEYVWGSKYGDAIAGSTGNDTLLGLDGPDALYGNKGADDLYGGASDGVTDGFVYLALTDSGNTKATRDTIHDFEGAGVSGGDKIILTNIDANTKTAADDAFHLLSQGDVSFDLTPGCLRWVHEKGTEDLTILQGDVNGDGKADFSIAVVGTVNFIGGDFSL